MRKILEEKYEKLFKVYHFERPLEASNINSVIKRSLKNFLKNSQRPAIYCNGGHTKMLMADFMYELKPVKYIIDNYAKTSAMGGFQLITDEEMESNGIDAVIISSFKFKDNIVAGLREKHPQIQYLNIYDEFSKNGIDLQSDYYYCNHPYHHYHTINTLQRKIDSLTKTDELKIAYRELITKYLHIKDFRMASLWAKKLCEVAEDAENRRLIYDLEELYAAELKVASAVPDNNILMLCIDGLRRQDLSGQYMPKLSEELSRHAYIFDHAYSFSTSTYESLIPVYSENGDLRTRYYENNIVSEKECRFIEKAKKQKRHIYFYTDMDEFVDSKEIKRSGCFQTVTEKLWNFLLDASEEENGLFYIHVLYESHFSFSNPYTKSPLISEGTAMLFDFLPQKGEKLRTDYEQQHIDSLHYLDDILSAFVNRLCCRILLYADHGNLILKKDCQLNEIREMQLTCADEWIQIPFVVKSPEMGNGISHRLLTLMSLNNVVDCLMEQKRYEEPQYEFIKVARSELYNPDFRYLYREMGKEKCLQAFEAFIFEGGWKLVIYADGTKELYKGGNEQKIFDSTLMGILFEKVKGSITVCNK